MSKKIKATQTLPGMKDPKKVAAGKARAAKSLRIDGKFTTNKFFEAVELDAKATGVKDTFAFFLQNEKLYQKVYETPMLSFTKNSETLRTALSEYDGRIFKNGKEVKASTAKKSVAELNRYLLNEHDVVAFYLKPEISLNGKMKIKVPSVKELIKRIKNGEDIDEILDEYDITPIRS